MADVVLSYASERRRVVLRSQVSQSSKWVRDEATCARDENKLVPPRIDGTPPPLGFRQVQSIDFSGWTGAGGVGDQGRGD